MLWLPIARLLVLQVAVGALPPPPSWAALQIKVPPSVKLTLPLGALPFTVAVNTTLAPTTAGLGELESVVMVPGKLAAATPQASISVMRE